MVLWMTSYGSNIKLKIGQTRKNFKIYQTQIFLISKINDRFILDRKELPLPPPVL